MSKEEFAASGLEKLTKQEKAALNNWLIQYTIGDGPVIRRTNQEVVEAEKSRQVITAIRQPFTGWSGDTLFYLDNGQIWRQRLPGKYHHNGSDTSVLIQKNFFGFYVLKMSKTGKSVGVSRVK